MQEETFSPQDASEKKPNAPVNPWPPADFSVAAAAAIMPVGDLIVGSDEYTIGRVVLPRPVPCRIFNREPAGVRKRGLKCATCGAQADEGETIVCTQ